MNATTVEHDAPLLPHLHGLDDGGQVEVPHGTGVRLHVDVVEPFKDLVEAAAADGIAIRACSGHRSFADQLRIWNGKARGHYPLLDAHGRPLDAKSLSADALIEAILRWSALPGASRHHWGTDMDVYDTAAVPPGYQPELTPEESHLRFGALHAWLDAHMGDFGFYRPYARDLGGVAPEPWHLSYALLATKNLLAFSLEGLHNALYSADMELKGRVLERLPELFDRYAMRVCPP